MEFKIKAEVRWADLDPNFHMLHSRYYDLGAFCRMSLLVQHGWTPQRMLDLNIGPILFREECLFKNEILFGDEVWIDVKLLRSTTDFSRWTMVHELTKNDGIFAAQITCDGAWMNTSLRKLTVPPEDVQHIFQAAPKANDFSVIVKEQTGK